MSDYNFTIIKGHQTLTSETAFVLYELDLHFFPTPWSFDSWKDLFINQQGFLVLLKRNDSIIGFCLFDTVVADSFAYLLKILIIPNERSKGRAKVLLNEALRNLDADRFSRYFLEVEEDNLSAIRLYLGSGFKTIHIKKHFYGENRSALIMTKS